MELVRQTWEAWERGDFATALANISPDMVAYTDSRLPFPDVYPGPAGLIRLQRDWAEGFDEVAVTTRQFIDAGEDKVVVRALHAARGAASGAPVETDIWYVLTIHARKWVRADVFNDKGRAFEAAGLRE